MNATAMSEMCNLALDFSGEREVENNIKKFSMKISCL